ncbi:MAG: glycosyltransferase [bacterium]|nr:MAG: glycosyltransferase [bacterium]
MKVAIVHDWLTGKRGGEKVLEVLCEIFPRAPIYTLLYNPGSVSETIESHEIYCSFIDKLPFKKRKYRHYLPLFPTAIEQFNLKDYQLIISSSHCVAKGIIPGPDSLHLSYLHTPMRYVWDMYHDYFGPGQVGKISGKIIPVFANYLRSWDVSSSCRVDWFAANSRHVANRIRKYYRRDAQVIHPPVETSLFKVHQTHDDFDLVVSALVPYKRVDLAVLAYNEMGRKLVIIGDGPERKNLLKVAKPNIQFLEWQSHQELIHHYSKCRALIFPGEEDFGIVPVEAMSCGKPVIAFARGGALETIIDADRSQGKKGTGILFSAQNTENLIQAVKKSDAVSWDSDFIYEHAKKFDREKFKSDLQYFIEQKVTLYLNR